jgi:hypothetical protein
MVCTCFEHYLLILRRCAPSGTWYIASVLYQLAASELKRTLTPNKLNRKFITLVSLYWYNRFNLPRHTLMHWGWRATISTETEVPVFEAIRRIISESRIYTHFPPLWGPLGIEIIFQRMASILKVCLYNFAYCAHLFVVAFIYTGCVTGNGRFLSK